MQMNVTIVHSELFRSHERRVGEDLPLDLILANACAPTKLEKEEKRPRSAIVAAVKQMLSKHRRRFNGTFTLPPLAV